VSWFPCLVRVHHGGLLVEMRLGHPLVDDYLAFVGARRTSRVATSARCVDRHQRNIDSVPNC
jgi:hypothetical protein